MQRVDIGVRRSGTETVYSVVMNDLDLAGLIAEASLGEEASMELFYGKEIGSNQSIPFSPRSVVSINDKRLGSK